jgi:hypothetical protein
MAELPVLAEAVSDGSLGADKARSIAKVAEPSTEAALVEMALHATTNQTQRLCGKYRTFTERQASDPDDVPAQQRPTVIVVRDEDGVEIRARFDHLRGELVLASLEAATRQVRTERREAAPPPGAETNPADGRTACGEDVPVEKLTAAQWRAEGLLRLAGSFTAERPEGLQPSGFDTTVVVHVGIDTLYDLDMEPASTLNNADGRAAEAPPPAGIVERSAPPHDRPPSTEGLPASSDEVPPTQDPSPSRSTAWSLPPPAEAPDRAAQDAMSELEPSGARIRRDLARMLACDAAILTVIDDADGNPLHLGRRHSTIPPRLRRAVMARYRTCAWPGCTATAVQLHHIHHRSHGGHDDVEAVAPECLAHHRTIHLNGIWITRDPDGTFHHHRPDGTEILANPTGPSHTDALTAPARLQTERVTHGGHPQQTSRQPLWQGDPLRLADAIGALLHRRDAGLRRTTPTGAPPATAHTADGRFDHPPPHQN